MTIFSGAYFKENPGKVLGKIVTHNPNTGKALTNAFGKLQPEVRGTIEDVIKGIKAPSVMRYEHFKELSPVNKIVDQVDVQSDKKRLAQAIQKTRQQQTIKKGTFDLQPLKDTIKSYNTDVEYTDYSTNIKGVKRKYTISDEEIKVWVTYQTKRGLFDENTILKNAWGAYYVADPDWMKWFKKGLVGFDGNEWIPAPLFYSGNIYLNIAGIKENESQIVSMIGADGFKDQLNRLDQSKPLMLLLTEDESRKLYLSPFHKIWSEIEIKELSDGTIVKENYSIGSIFFDYFLRDLPKEDFIKDRKTTSAYDIYYYFIEKRNFPRGRYSEQEKAVIKRNTTIIGSALFDRFLLEMLTREDRNRIAGLWNSQYNNYKDIEYHKIPVGFSINKKFKGGDLEMRAAQREGVGFMNHRGTGIVAYDVGVGKTMTAIAAISDGMEKGLFKRPMIVVPQKVYKKWIAEISGVKTDKDIKKGKTILHKKGAVISEGILPHIQINDYDNLGVNHLEKVTDKNGVALTVPEFSITMVTFEGLEKIGFSEASEGDLVTNVKEMLSQGQSGRAGAIIELQSEKWIDNALAKTEVDIEDMGIDCIIVDETHNFRVLFTEVKGDIDDDGEREKKNFLSGGGGSPSTRALKLFMLNMYIQNKNKGRNTFGLTATPFTNRVTEIYTMLAHYDSEGLKQFNVFNLAQFCTNYIDESLEDVWTVSGKFDIKAVIRGFNNLPSLQSLVFRAINYKTGEDANILRPEKVVLPLFNDEKGVPLAYEFIADSKVPPSEEQNRWFEEIRNFINYKRNDSGELVSSIFNYYPFDPKKMKVLGDVLIALNASRVATFSPYAVSFGGQPMYNPGEIPAKKFIERSPKLKYIAECIRTVKNYHDEHKEAVSGQIIYSDRGTEWFYHIKEYLVTEIGYADSEVEIFHGKVSKGKRESIKDGFQEGKVKIIIGSSTLREGVDLQNHCSVIYLAYIDWNPTDLHQLWGRGWRFGNKHTHIRIVVPLVENSSDIFTWQKLSEKMSRINSIWSRSDRTKMFEESELNAEELKKGLINDPEELAKWEIDEEVSKVKSELSLHEANLNALQEAKAQKDTFAELSTQLEKLANEAITNPTGIDEEIREKLVKLKVTDIKSIYLIVRRYADAQNYYYTRIDYRQKIDQHIKYRKRLQRVEESILKPYKLTLFDNINPVIDDLNSKVVKLNEQKAIFLSEEHKQNVLAKVIEEKERNERNSKPLSERVNEFARLNYLLDCKEGIHTCDIMGRVVIKESGKHITIRKQPKVSFEIDEGYKMCKGLKKMMPNHQQIAVKGIIADSGDDYIDSVLKPLENQIKSIPNIKAQEGKGNKAVVYAHYFLGGSDWYIIEWDRDDRLFAYVILNGDEQMAELGYISLKELTSISTNASVQFGSRAKSFKQGIELDFFWTEKTLGEVKGIEEKPAPLHELSQKDSLEEAIAGLEAAMEFADKENRLSLSQAIEGLKAALFFV